jgi:hypothetical protein
LRAIYLLSDRKDSPVGLVIAGPPGAFIGIIVGAIWGKPWWGPDESAYKCWIDSNFSRHCPKLPVR